MKFTSLASVILMVSLGVSTPAAHDLSLSRRFPKETLRQALIPLEAWHPLPRWSEREAWQAIPASVRTSLVAAAEKSASRPLSSLPASLYLEFARNGNRSRFEAAYNEHRNRLHTLVIGECVEGKSRFLDAIGDSLWVIFEESSWCIPAHVGVQKAGVGLPDTEEPIVDLFAAQTANSLAWTDYLLGEQLQKISPLLRPRLAKEVRRRILEPYAAREDFGWMGFRSKLPSDRPNNWNPWINSNVLTAALLMEKDPQARIALVDKVIRSLDRYLGPYPSDGSCDEGPGYWGVAGASLFDNLELLRLASNGKIDVFDHPVIGEIGRFIVRSHIAGDYYVNIGDNPARLQPDRSLVFRFGMRVGDRPMQALAAWGATWEELDGGSRSLGRTLDALFSWRDLMAAQPAGPPLPGDVWLPSEDMQMMAARDRAGSDRGLYLAAWGGHNGQSHNHNDVGNFILFADGQPILVDPGRPAYTRQTFSKERYQIWAMQSAFHNLPTVGGVQQSAGLLYKAGDVVYRADEASAEIRMDIAGAYPPDAGLKSWKRTARLDRGKQVVIEESVAFAREGKEILLNLITPCAMDTSRPGRLTFLTSGAVQEKELQIVLEYDAAKFSALVEPIRLDDGGLNRIWNGRLQRIQMRKTAGPADDRWRLRIGIDRAGGGK